MSVTPVGVNLSERINRCVSSPLRDIFRAIEQPGMISFAGGLPDGEMFPDIEDVVEAVRGVRAPCSNSVSESIHVIESIHEKVGENSQNDIRHNDIPEFFQYGSSNGEPELRQLAADYVGQSGLDVRSDQIIILSGSQQGIDLAAKLLIDQGTGVSVCKPTYLAALQSFTLFGASYHALETDAFGYSNLENSSVVYINPTFSNPTSVNFSKLQRQQLAASCDHFNTVLVEDDAYRELYYEDCDRQPVSSYLSRANWVYLGSFSKTIAPGLRIGYMAVSDDLLPFMTRLKQASDLHSSRLAQQVIIHLLQQEDYQEKQDRLRLRYKGKRDHFDSILFSHWSDIAEWKKPAGGMFFWVKLKIPLSCSLTDVLGKAIGRGVAFMPGEYFYPQDNQHNRLHDGNPFEIGVDSPISMHAGSTIENTEADSPGQMLRLNFTNAGRAEARQGLIRLASLIKEHS